MYFFFHFSNKVKVSVKVEMGLEDQRKSLKGHIQNKSVWMQLNSNIPMPMDLQGLIDAIINVLAMQNSI